jgi:predicted DNA repair protein MutK
MELKLMKISTKSFILIFSTINVIAGFIVGAIVTMMSLLTPDEQNSATLGVWAILIFPFANGLLGFVTGALLTTFFNFFAKRFGGLKLEFEGETQT